MERWMNEMGNYRERCLTTIRKVFMKFVSVRTKQTHRRRRSAKSPRANHESTPTAASHQIHTYAELRQQIHDDLRLQHPEWVQPNGECPMCDVYDARLVKELESLTPSDSTSLSPLLIAP
jgi:hypothetical protein